MNNRAQYTALRCSIQASRADNNADRYRIASLYRRIALLHQAPGFAIERGDIFPGSGGLSGYAALQFLCSSTNMWLADPQNTCSVGDQFLQTLCWHWIQLKAPNVLVRCLQKDQTKGAWFSEPPNKELAVFKLPPTKCQPHLTTIRFFWTITA